MARTGGRDRSVEVERRDRHHYEVVELGRRGPLGIGVDEAEGGAAHPEVEDVEAGGDDERRERRAERADDLLLERPPAAEGGSGARGVRSGREGAVRIAAAPQVRGAAAVRTTAV